MESNKIINVSFDSVFVLTLLTSFFYAAGTAYYQGQMKYWGLINLPFTKNFHEMIYNGFFIIAASALNILMAIVLPCTVLLLLYSFRHKMLKAFTWIKQKRKKQCPEENKDPKTPIEETRIDKIIFSLYTSVMVSFTVLIMVVLMFIYFRHCGYQSGLEAHRKYLKGGYSNEEMDMVMNGKTEKVLVVDCSGTMCAVLKKSDKHIEIVDMDQLKGARKAFPTL